jgi:hypothetical protein
MPLIVPIEPEFHNGYDGKALVTPGIPGGTITDQFELPISRWDLRIQAHNREVSNNRDGRWRIPGLVDASGQATMHYDNANRPSDLAGGTPAGPNIRHGSILQLQLNPDGTNVVTNSFRLTVIIDEVRPTADFNGSLDYDFTYSLQRGANIKYPGDT